MTGNDTYRCWTWMRAVCHNKKNPHYRTTGGKGVDHCAKWGTFAGFLDDMGERPPGARLRRNDLGKDYDLHNCYWYTRPDVTKPDTDKKATKP